MSYLTMLCLILITTLIAGQISRRLGQPAVIGQLLIGIVLGPAVLNWIKPNTFVNDFAEIGVIILMFIAGLESDLDLLKKYLKPSIIVAVSGVVLPIILTSGYGYLIGMNKGVYLFLGITFAATSVSISVEVLKELHVLDSVAGTTILGAAVVDDIVTVLALSLLVSVTKAQGAGVPKLPLGLSLLLQLLFFGIIYLVVKYVAPLLMHLASKFFTLNVSETTMSMIICLAMAVLADTVGLSAVLGSFFAGVAVAQTSSREEIDAKIEPIGYAVFIPVFFVSVGLKMTLSDLKETWLFIFIVTILAIIGKLGGCAIGAKLANLNWSDAYQVGSGMVSRGEMALIVAQIGYNAHLLSDDYYSAVIVAIVITTLLAPVILRHAIKNHQAKLLDGQH